MSRYAGNFFLGMTPRQTICAAAALFVVAAGSLLLHLPGALCVLLAFPLLPAGFYRPDGLPLEKWLTAWIQSKWRDPVVRIYEPENDVYDFLWRGVIGGRKCFDPKAYLEPEEARRREKMAKRRRRRETAAPLREPERQAQSAGEPDADILPPDPAGEQNLAGTFRRLLGEERGGAGGGRSDGQEMGRESQEGGMPPERSGSPYASSGKAEDGAEASAHFLADIRARRAASLEERQESRQDPAPPIRPAAPAPEILDIRRRRSSAAACSGKGERG